MSNISDTSITVGNKIIVHLAKIPCIKLFVGICYIYIYNVLYISNANFLLICVYIYVGNSKSLYLLKQISHSSHILDQSDLILLLTVES